MKKIFVSFVVFTCTLGNLYAHTALMRCMENSDATIFCEAGFSDGSSAEGVALKIVQDGKIVYETKFDEDSEATFKKPKGEYTVIFDGGDGHSLNIQGKEIIK